MKEQYLVQYQTKWDVEKGEDRWWNAVWLQSGCNKRYASTLKEAQEYLNKAIQNGEKNATKWTTQEIGHSGLGISFEPNEGMRVVNTRIRKRQVTEWEEV